LAVVETSVSLRCRCGEMADAQDLKFSKSHFLTTSRDFFSHAFQPLFTSLFSILAWFRRTAKRGGFPTPKVAQKVAQKSFKIPTNWKICTGLSPGRVRLFFAFLRLCHFWFSAQQITCSHQEIYNLSHCATFKSESRLNYGQKNV
jgi:hypothetical protein